MLQAFTIHSPEEKINLPLFRANNVDVFVKRDDMIHPFISGNKWRKLKYTLEKAMQEGKDHLVTFGGAWSNHLLATACAGATFGFSTEAFVRGDMISNPVLSMCQLFGMKLHFVSRDAYRDKACLFEKVINPKAFFIDEGGYSKEAARGCSDIVHELQHTYDHIYCAAGTGATSAGIAKGIQEQNLQAILHVVPVLKGGDFIAEEIKKLQAPLDQITLHLDYHFGGYAKTKPELLAFVKDFICQTGIMIEPTYTGKALFALCDAIRAGHIKPYERVLFVHTGGLTGLLGMLDRFAPILPSAHTEETA